MLKENEVIKILSKIDFEEEFDEKVVDEFRRTWDKEKYNDDEALIWFEKEWKWNSDRFKKEILEKAEEMLKWEEVETVDWEIKTAKEYVEQFFS